MTRFLGLAELFGGRHFDREIFVLCVRWHLRFKLSFRGLGEMMAERGLSIAHTTIMRWVHHYAPEFERRWAHFAQPAGDSWRRVDETYVKVRGEWVYLYRAVISAPGATLPWPRPSFARRQGAGIGTTDRHVGWLCRIAPRRARDEVRRRTACRNQAAVIKVLEQSE